MSFIALFTVVCGTLDMTSSRHMLQGQQLYPHLIETLPDGSMWQRFINKASDYWGSSICWLYWLHAFGYGHHNKK